MKRIKTPFMKMLVLIGTCFLWASMGSWAQFTAYRVIEYGDDWPEDPSIRVMVSISGERGVFSLMERPPEEGIVSNIVSDVFKSHEVVDGTITWDSKLSIPSNVKDLQYELELPSTASHLYEWNGSINDKETIGLVEFDPGHLNPGMQTPIMPDSLCNYLVYLPSTYYEFDGKWPLIIFLHGSAEVGKLNILKAHSLPKLVEEPFTIHSIFDSYEFPFIVVSPQSPPDRNLLFENDHLLEVLDHVINVKQLKVDTGQIYVTGFSSGGISTWNFASQHPDIPAAIVPIAGPGISEEIAATFPSSYDDVFVTDPNVLVDMPIWAFLGARDQFIPVEVARFMVDQVNAAGGNAKFTLLPEVGHFPDPAYHTPELYDWLLAQQKSMSAVSYWECY